MKIHCQYSKLVKLSELKPHPKNPNTHSNAQIERLAKILEYQGWRYPVKVSKLSGYVTSGHGRIEAAKKNKWKEVPVSFQDYENEDQEYADIVSDNSIAEWAELDLSAVNSEIENLGPDFDIDFLGLQNFEIDPSDKMIEKVNKGDENSEWAGMPEFEEGSDYIKLIFQFKTELERELFVKENKIHIDHKMKNQWIVQK